MAGLRELTRPAALRIGEGTNDRVVLGHDWWGHPVSLPVADKAGAMNWLIGGTPGSGKSNTLSVVLADVARRPGVALVLGDPKFVEFGPWVGRSSCLALGRERQVDLLGLLEKEMDRRYRHLARSSEAAYVRKWRVGEDGPRIVAVFDEIAAFVRGAPKEREVVVARLVRLLSMGRAAEMVFILCTQRPSAVALPTDIRDSCQLRLCHKTMSADQTEMILGVSKVSGVPIQPHDLPATARGVGFLLTDLDPQVQLFRSYRMDDDDVVRAGRATAELRVPLADWPPTLTPDNFND